MIHDMHNGLNTCLIFLRGLIIQKQVRINDAEDGVIADSVNVYSGIFNN
jgi:hypothetical protein